MPLKATRANNCLLGVWLLFLGTCNLGGYLWSWNRRCKIWRRRRPWFLQWALNCSHRGGQTCRSLRSWRQGVRRPLHPVPGGAAESSAALQLQRTSLGLTGEHACSLPTQLVSTAQAHRKRLFRAESKILRVWYSPTFSQVCPLFCVLLHPGGFWLFPWHTQVTQRIWGRLCPSRPEGLKEGQLRLPDSAVLSRIENNI